MIDTIDALSRLLDSTPLAGRPPAELAVLDSGEVAPEQAGVQALIIEELRWLHEGVLARYGLRPSEYAAWKAMHGY